MKRGPTRTYVCVFYICMKEREVEKECAASLGVRKCIYMQVDRMTLKQTERVVSSTGLFSS